VRWSWLLRLASGGLGLLTCMSADSPRGVLGRGRPAVETLEPRQIRAIVDELVLIETMTPKRGMPQGDEHALAILSLGRAAVPYLVERIDDDSWSRYVYGYWYKVGDVALALLDEICDTPNWFFPDGSRLAPPTEFADFVDFVQSPQQLRAAKRSWERFYQIDGCKTGPWVSGKLRE
jgi:hypothetical protein